jgi:hypothetical protein
MNSPAVNSSPLFFLRCSRLGALLAACFLFGCTAAFAAAASVPARVAGPEAILRGSQAFALGRVGRGGSTSPETKALRELLSQPGAVARCEALFRSGNPITRAYALAGLKYARSPRYRTLARQAPGAPANVRMITGDVVRRVSLREVVTRLDRDYPSLPK